MEERFDERFVRERARLCNCFFAEIPKTEIGDHVALRLEDRRARHGRRYALRVQPFE
jgi:hypothetical protein